MPCPLLGMNSHDNPDSPCSMCNGTGKIVLVDQPPAVAEEEGGAVSETYDMSYLVGPPEPSDAERSEWPQATANYVSWLETRAEHLKIRCRILAEKLEAQPPAVTDELRLTKLEVKALDYAIQNCYGDGDWDEYLTSTGDGKQKAAFHRGWKKLQRYSAALQGEGE